MGSFQELEVPTSMLCVGHDVSIETVYQGTAQSSLYLADPPLHAPGETNTTSHEGYADAEPCSSMSMSIQAGLGPDSAVITRRFFIDPRSWCTCGRVTSGKRMCGMYSKFMCCCLPLIWMEAWSMLSTGCLHVNSRQDSPSHVCGDADPCTIRTRLSNEKVRAPK